MCIIAKAPLPGFMQDYSLYMVTGTDDDSDVVGCGFDSDDELAKKKAIYEFEEKEFSQRLGSGSTSNDVRDLTTALDGCIHFNIPPDQLSLVVEVQFQEYSLNGDAGSIHRVPIRGRIRDTDDWINLIPTSSSGFAAHSTPEAAFQAALFELVERDAFFVSWYGNVAANDITNEALPVAPEAFLFEQIQADCHFLELPTTNWNWKAIAAVLVRRDGKGFMIGLGAAASMELAIKKACNEVMFFFAWNSIFDDCKFQHRIDLSQYDGYASHLNYFWHQGRSSFQRLLYGERAQFHRDVDDLKVYSKQFALPANDRRAWYICGVYVPTFIPQHLYNTYSLNFGVVKQRWPNFKETWPITGLHPFT